MMATETAAAIVTATTATVATEHTNLFHNSAHTDVDAVDDGGDVANKTRISFDDFAMSRGRSARASSLALPNKSLLDLFDKEQQLLKSVSLTPTPTFNNYLRRHSSHDCPMADGKEQLQLQRCTNTVKQTISPVAHPPPVPKRTFQGKLLTKEINNSHADESKLQYNNSQLTGDIEDSSSIESSVFMDVGQTNDLVVFESSKSTTLIKSNRSSSDSNKSHTTNDTGYISATETERCSIIAHSSFRSRMSSEDTQSSTDSYMSSDYPHVVGIRLSDTNKTYCTNNDNHFYNDRTNITTNGTMTIGNNMSGGGGGGGGTAIPNYYRKSSNESRNNRTHSESDTQLLSQRLPAVPARRQQNLPPKLPPPLSNTNAGRHRGVVPMPPPVPSVQPVPVMPPVPPVPPIPPIRSQNSLDSGRLQQQIGNIFGVNTFVSANNGSNATTCGAKQPELHSRSISNNRKGIHGTHKPPPLTQIHQHTKFNQRQDSNISSDSFSITSSPGYNSKSMEVPLLQHAAKINRNGMRHQEISFTGNGKINSRQDSNVSSDSFSQTSSPSYNTKMMETPLLPHYHTVRMHHHNRPKGIVEITKELMPTEQHSPSSPITKSASTPASLQTIVRFQNGSNMSLQHRIIKRRKSSNPYITKGRLKFRLFQILLNAVALLAIAGGLAVYFNAYPTVRFVNKTIFTPQISTVVVESREIQGGTNPVPGVCLPVIVKFCKDHHVPYNYTLFPNYMGNFGQIEAQADLEVFDGLVDVQCYELVSLYLCSIFVPKCGPTGLRVPPCRSLCLETMRRCGFFFRVFGLELPDYIQCNILTDYLSPDECVGGKEVREVARQRNHRRTCTNGFLCDKKRCLPPEWRCDGHVDCLDQTDESNCDICPKGHIYCGDKKCMAQKHVCDGIQDCPWGQDERNCIRLSEQNGNLGKGILQIYKADKQQWAAACINHWDPSTSPSAVCSLLGYSSVNSSNLKLKGSNHTLSAMAYDSQVLWRMYQKKHTNLMKEFSSCPPKAPPRIVELTCSNFECGKTRSSRGLRPKVRIVGGFQSAPGDWPFLAAILGGPEEIFYCSGVLIADQWVLTASHCIGNHTAQNHSDWTIQLGITRRHSHTYYGQKVKIIKVIPHPQYNALVPNDNDIALFQLKTRVAFHEHLLPVCLPPPLKELKPGTMCTVIGWGKKEDKTGKSSSASIVPYEPAVNEVRVPILHRDLCNEWLEQQNITEGMICAGYKEGGKDACQGDSGGPLLCRNEESDQWFVGGIVSWGIMCAHPKLPGVYANVPKYIPWINQEMNSVSSTATASTTMPTISKFGVVAPTTPSIN